MSKQRIYFDHSATTPVDKTVLKEMLPYFDGKYGNPSSIHGFGQEALRGIDEARERLSVSLNSSFEEIIFTSGATESNNLAIKGFFKAIKKKGVKKPHIITSLIEHSAVLEPCADLVKEGARLDHVPVDASGVVDLKKLEAMICEDTVLVTIMYVNSEIGSVQPIREIGKIIKKINEKRVREWQKRRPKDRGEKPERIYFHTDATQALNFFECNTAYFHVDMLSLSGHKIYGPKGVGALYVRKGTPMEAIQLGGHHESGFRSGTLNSAGIIGLGKAVSLLSREVQEKDNKKIAKLRDLLVDGIIKAVPDVILNTNRDVSTPAHAHFSFLGIEGESMLISLDFEGIAVSTGSACASGSLKASHVLIAMGMRKEVAHNSIRFSLGKNNTEAEIKTLLRVLPPIAKRLRDINPLYKK